MNLVEWLTERLYTFATNYFHKWYGLLASLFIIVIAAFSVYEYLLSERIPFLYYTIGTGILAFLFVLYWLFFKFYYPSRSGKRLGLVIGVRAENAEESKFLEADFVRPLKARIKNARLPFHIILLKQHQVEAIEGDDDARRVLKKTKAQFILWGSVKKRQDRYFFDLRGMVVHGPIKEAQRVLLISEFDLLLPNKLAFEEALQPEAFEFRAEQSYTSIDYITGRAALLTGDVATAIKLHEPLYLDMEKGLSMPISKDRLRKILSVEYDLQAAIEWKTGSLNYPVSVAKSYLYNPNNYGALLKKAIIDFKGGEGDPNMALATVKQAKRHAGGGEWRYSEIFLNFWIGNYKTALLGCARLKEKDYECDSQTPDEIIPFNEELLTKYDKPQLYYWLGFVAYEKKQNPTLADTYFQKFIDSADDSMKELVSRAEIYLTDIRKTIKY